MGWARDGGLLRYATTRRACARFGVQSRVEAAEGISSREALAHFVVELDVVGRVIDPEVSRHGSEREALRDAEARIRGMKRVRTHARRTTTTRAG